MKRTGRPEKILREAHPRIEPEDSAVTFETTLLPAIRNPGFAIVKSKLLSSPLLNSPNLAASP
jgi:hypothetical protein